MGALNGIKYWKIEKYWKYWKLACRIEKLKNWKYWNIESIQFQTCQIERLKNWILHSILDPADWIIEYIERYSILSGRIESIELLNPFNIRGGRLKDWIILNGSPAWLLSEAARLRPWMPSRSPVSRPKLLTFADAQVAQILRFALVLLRQVRAILGDKPGPWALSPRPYPKP